MPTRLCIRGTRTMRVVLLYGTADKCYQLWEHSLSTSTSCLPQHCSTGISTQGMHTCSVQESNNSSMVLILELSVCGYYVFYLIWWRSVTLLFMIFMIISVCRTVLHFSHFYHYRWQGDIWSKIPFKVSENCGKTFMFSHSPSPCSAKVLAKTFLTCMLWGLVMQFMAGYLFLHCWNNLFGELLRFADREFYSVRLIVCYFWCWFFSVCCTGLVDVYLFFPILSQVELACTRLDKGIHLPRPQGCTLSNICWP